MTSALLATLPLIGLAACSHSSPPSDQPREAVVRVQVEEDLSDLPIGTTVRLCLGRMPCKADTVRPNSQRNSQSIALPLPAGISAKAANGWPLRAYATSAGTSYQASTRVIYHVSIDPPCRCAGDYAYVQLRRVPAPSH